MRFFSIFAAAASLLAVVQARPLLDKRADGEEAGCAKSVALRCLIGVNAGSVTCYNMAINFYTQNLLPLPANFLSCAAFSTAFVALDSPTFCGPCVKAIGAKITEMGKTPAVQAILNSKPIQAPFQACKGAACSIVKATQGCINGICKLTGIKQKPKAPLLPIASTPNVPAPHLNNVNIPPPGLSTGFSAPGTTTSTPASSIPPPPRDRRGSVASAAGSSSGFDRPPPATNRKGHVGSQPANAPSVPAPLARVPSVGPVPGSLRRSSSTPAALTRSNSFSSKGPTH